jgi:Fe-S-cluster-containing hydrogenase component 2
MNELVVLAERCTGCETCAIVCSLSHEGRANPVESRIAVIKNERQGVNFPLVCAQCETPTCKLVCPVAAIHVERGVVRTDLTKCVGCRMCVLSCPLGATSMNSVTHQIIRCDLCDGDPLCVRFCPEDAIQYAPLDVGQAHLRRERVQNLVALLDR